MLELHNQKLKPISSFESNLIIFHPCSLDKFTELHLARRKVLISALPGEQALPLSSWYETAVIHCTVYGAFIASFRGIWKASCVSDIAKKKAICSQKSIQYSIQLELPWSFFMIQSKMECKENRNVMRKYELD